MLTTGSAVIPSADAPLSPEIPGLHLLPPLHTFQDGKSHFGHKLFLRFTTDFTLPCGKVITSSFDSGNETNSRLCYCRAEIISKMESMGVDSIQDVMAHVPGLRLTGASFILNHIRTCKFMSKAEKEAATSGYKGNYLVLDKNSLRSIIDEIAALDNETATLSLSSYRMEVRAAEYEVGERGLMDLARYWRIPLPNESRAHNGGMEKGALVNAIVNAIQDVTIRTTLQPQINLPDLDAVRTFFHDAHQASTKEEVLKLVKAIAFQPKVGKTLVGYGLKRIAAALPKHSPFKPSKKKENKSECTRLLVELIWTCEDTYNKEISGLGADILAPDPRHKDIRTLFPKSPSPSKGISATATASTSSISRPKTGMKRDIIKERKNAVSTERKNAKKTVNHDFFAPRKPEEQPQNSLDIELDADFDLDDDLDDLAMGVNVADEELGGSPPWSPWRDDDSDDDSMAFPSYEEYGDNPLVPKAGSRKWVDGDDNGDEYASLDEEMVFKEKAPRAGGRGCDETKWAAEKDEYESTKFKGPISTLISRIQDTILLSRRLRKITEVFAEYVVGSGLTFSIEDISSGLQSLPYNALDGMLDLGKALCDDSIPMDQAWDRMFGKGGSDGRAPTVYDAFILIAEDGVKDFEETLSTLRLDPSHRDADLIASLSISTRVLLDNQRFRIVAGYSGITTAGVDGRTKSTRSMSGDSHLAVLLRLVGLLPSEQIKPISNTHIQIKLFSPAKPYASLQLATSRGHIRAQLIRLPTIPTPDRTSNSRYLRSGSVLECIAIASMQRKALGSFACANKAPGGDPVIYDCGDDVRRLAAREGAMEGLQRVHYIFSAPPRVIRSTDPDDPFKGPNMATLRGMQSSILSDSAFPDQAWTEPRKSLRVMDVDEDGIIEPFEVWSDAYDMEIMRETGRRVIQRQKDVDGALGDMDLGESSLSGSNRRYRGNVVLGIMSQKVARSLPEFRSLGLVQFRQAYATRLNQTWVGDFDDENLIGIPMTLMQEPVRSRYLGSLKSAQVAAAKGLTMLMLSGNLADKSSRGLAEFKALPHVAKFCRSLITSTNKFQQEIRQNSINNTVVTSLPATVLLRSGATSILVQAAANTPVIAIPFPAPEGFEGYIEVQIEPHRTMPSTVILKILSIDSAWPMSDSMEDMERFYGVMDRETGYMRKGRGSGSTYSVNAEKRGEGYTIHPLLPLIKAAQENLLAAPKVDLEVADLY